MNRPAERQDPPYARIVAEIRRRVAAGELRAGERVPSTRAIAREFGVALATATKAMAALKQAGVVRAVPRVGTVVAAPEPRPAATPRATRRRDGHGAEPEFTQERIVRAAIDIADAEGLPALSMRRLAMELGVPTMSLYRDVRGKDEVVLLMADAVFAEAALPDPPPPGWRAQLELVARQQWAVCRRHPWVTRTISLTRPLLVPSGMAYTEWAIRAMDGLGLDLNTMVHVAVTLAGYVQGIAVNLDVEVAAEQDTGVTSDEWMTAQGVALDAIIASGRFPMLARMADRPDLDVSLDAIFEVGLKLLLDGLAGVVEGAAGRPA